MTKKDKDNGAQDDRQGLFIQQLKIVAINNRVDAMTQRKNAIAQELNLLAIKQPEAEQERDKLIEDYKPRYEALKVKLEVPEGSELNLETGEVVENKAQ